MNREALQVKKISKTTLDERIVEVLEIRFDNSIIDDCIEKFNCLKNKGVIHEGEFFNDKWILIYTIDNDIKKYINYEFNIDIDSQTNIAIKCFIIIKLYYIEFGTIHGQRMKKFIEESILSTNYFDNKYIDNEEQKLLDMSNTNRSQYCNAIINFFKFYPKIRENRFYHMYSEMTSSNFVSIPRRLPNYSSIILFDYIIDDFFSCCSRNERHKFLILNIWWKLTKIIPMRSIEFLILRRECIRYVEENGKYFITIKRVKNIANKSKVNSIKILEEIEVNEEIFELINEYKAFTQEQNNKKYLWSYESYNSFAIKNGGKLKKNNIDYLGHDQLYRILDDFYTNIIEDKYGYKVIRKEDIIKKNESILTCNPDEIIMLDIGDTRHFAFCSLMLQGLNPLTIAQIGGHHKLQTQNHYHSHLETFLDSNVLETAKFLLHRQKFNVGKEHIISDGKELMILNIDRDNTFQPIYMHKDYGYCWNKNMPHNCHESDCYFCKFFELDSNINKTVLKNLLNNKEKKLNSELEIQLGFLKDMSCESVNNRMVDTTKQEVLSTTSNKINSIIKRKSLVKFKQLSLNEIEAKDV